MDRLSTDDLLELAAILRPYSAKSNPYHEPAGSPEGGQFASADQGEGVPFSSVTMGYQDVVPYVGGTSPDHDKMEALKVGAAHAIADRINTPERIAAIAKADGMVNYIDKGTTYAVIEVNHTPIADTESLR